MHQVKLFKGVETELSALETDINTWLRSSGARVVNVVGNIAPQSHRAEGSGPARGFAPSDLFLAVVFEPSD